jgi:hypothetical protein
MKISPPVRLTCSPASASERLDRQLLPPFTLQVQQVADVAELAMQVAPHRRFVDEAGRQPPRPSVLVAQESLDALFVLPPAIARKRVGEEGNRAGPARDAVTQPLTEPHG